MHSERDQNGFPAEIRLSSVLTVWGKGCKNCPEPSLVVTQQGPQQDPGQAAGVGLGFDSDEQEKRDPNQEISLSATDDRSDDKV